MRVVREGGGDICRSLCVWGRWFEGLTCTVYGGETANVIGEGGRVRGVCSGSEGRSSWPARVRRRLRVWRGERDRFLCPYTPMFVHLHSGYVEWGGIVLVLFTLVYLPLTIIGGATGEPITPAHARGPAHTTTTQVSKAKLTNSYSTIAPTLDTSMYVICPYTNIHNYTFTHSMYPYTYRRSHPLGLGKCVLQFLSHHRAGMCG